MKCDEHEFNTGFVTALGKFLAHREKKVGFPGNDLRIYGASDHLFDIEIPEMTPKKLKAEIQKFVRDVFEVRLARISREEAEKLFRRADELLQEIDRQMFKLKHVCSNYP